MKKPKGNNKGTTIYKGLGPTAKTLINSPWVRRTKLQGSSYHGVLSEGLLRETEEEILLYWRKME